MRSGHSRKIRDRLTFDHPIDRSRFPSLPSAIWPSTSRLAVFAVMLCMSVLALGSLPTSARADGTEELGPPSIAIAQGTGTVLAGTGMASQPGTINISVPGDVVQVLLYWEGYTLPDEPGDDTIIVSDGTSTQSVTGILIGGPAPFGEDTSSAYRADITSLGLVQSGDNTLTVDDLDFSRIANGAGVLVIFDDGSGAFDIGLVDGVDTAFEPFPDPNQTTVAQSFTFEPENEARQASLDMFFSSVAGTASGGGPLRPSSIEVNVGGTTQIFSNLLNSVDGEEWDTTHIDVDIPAGAGSLTVQAFSRDDFDTPGGPSPASFIWLTGALTVPPLPMPAIELCTQVTLNPNMRDDFSDADALTGDGCDIFDQSVPVGVAGMVDGTYRLKITNTGDETLVNVRINAPDFGLEDQPIPADCGDLDPGEMCVIDFDEPDDTFIGLKVFDVCEAPGSVTKMATVDADGANSEIPVSDDDPAIVECVVDPNITLRKEVRFDGGEFVDANTPDTGPTGLLGADAEYRLIVENDGNETLVNAVINDETLGLENVPVPGGPLQPGDIRTITQGSAGFEMLFVENRCDVAGRLMNTALVKALGMFSEEPVESEDPAWVNCESPRITLLKQVSLDGVNFFDADNPGDPDVPVGIVGLTDATYRFVVTNEGSETLTSVLVEDAVLESAQSSSIWRAAKPGSLNRAPPVSVTCSSPCAAAVSPATSRT